MQDEVQWQHFVKKGRILGLSVTNLACARGGLPLLDGVGFSLGAGQALVLRGPNGCGKTTLLRTIAGIQPALAGDILCLPDAIAYAAHADGLKTTLSVAENLSFWAAIYGTKDIEDALDKMNLRPLAGRAAQNLSAGQKRRLGLARLMVTGRPIWVLDEPTVSLDADSVALFADVVRAHLAGGGMALMATHIDLGLPEAGILDLTRFKARWDKSGGGNFDEAFL